MLSLLWSASSAFTAPFSRSPSPSSSSSAASKQHTCDGSNTARIQFFLYSSLGDDNSNSEGEDELSKLLNKRKQLQRKRQEDMNAKMEKMVEKIGPIVDLDVAALPEFNTMRPERQTRKKSGGNGDDDNNNSKQQQQQDAPPIVDFLADYDDENDLHIPNRIGVTSVAWGDLSRNFQNSAKSGGKGGKLTKRMQQAGMFVAGDAQLAHNMLLQGGITFVETAPTYGAVSNGQKLSACHILKECLEEGKLNGLPDTVLAVSMGSSAWSKLRPTTMVASLEDALAKLQSDTLELFTIPKSKLFPSVVVANALASAIESGQCSYVGVEGVTNGRTLKSLKKKLSTKDVTLTSNTFEFSLTNRNSESMIDICKSLGIIPLIRNPLDGGLASGVFTASNPSGGQAGAARGKFTFKQLDKLQPLHSVMDTVADRVGTRVRRESMNIKEKFKPRYGPGPKINTDITTTQIAINYVVAKGGVPLVEVNTPRQAEEVLGCLGWTLSDEEVAMLDSAAALCQM